MPDGQKVVGVLGGMGPEATLAFYANVIAATPAKRDQDHLQVIINSNPKIADRTAAVLGAGPSPVPAMVESLEALARAGASFVVIPCVSAHAFIDELGRASPLPLISILDVVAAAIAAHPARVQRVALLATTGTIRAGVFERRLNASGVDVLCPGDAEQRVVSASIQAVKAGATAAERRAIAGELRRVTDGLVAASAQGIVLGCTEIPLVFPSEGAGVPVFDSLKLFAQAAVAAAGLPPVLIDAPGEWRN